MDSVQNKLTMKPTQFSCIQFQGRDFNIEGEFIFMKTSCGVSCLADRFLRY
jgi:hypothetical protein